jgi:hypothetical protein
VELARLTKTKIACFLLYVEDKSKNKYKHCHVDMYTDLKHVSSGGNVRGD